MYLSNFYCIHKNAYIFFPLLLHCFNEYIRRNVCKTQNVTLMSHVSVTFSHALNIGSALYMGVN